MDLQVLILGSRYRISLPYHFLGLPILSVGGGSDP